MRSALGILALLSAAAMFEGGAHTTRGGYMDEDDLRPKGLSPQTQKARGLTLFNIDGKEVWALNRKSAEKKAKKLKK